MGGRRRLIIGCKSPRDGPALPEASSSSSSSSVDCLFGVYWGHVLDSDYVLGISAISREIGGSFFLCWDFLCANSRELHDSEVCVWAWIVVVVVVPFQNGHESACATCMKLCNTKRYDKSASSVSQSIASLTCMISFPTHLVKLAKMFSFVVGIDWFKVFLQ